MPLARYVKKARKDNPAVKAGESYWWWSTRTTVGKKYVSRKHYSATRPRASQLASSEYWSTCYGHMETITEDLGAIDCESACEDAVNTIDDVKSEFENYRDELEERRAAVGDAFHDQGHAFELLSQRVDALEAVIDSLDTARDELESIDWPEEPDEDDEAAHDEYRVLMDEATDAARGAIDDIEWTFE